MKDYKRFIELRQEITDLKNETNNKIDTILVLANINKKDVIFESDLYNLDYINLFQKEVEYLKQKNYSWHIQCEQIRENYKNKIVEIKNEIDKLNLKNVYRISLYNTKKDYISLLKDFNLAFIKDTDEYFIYLELKDIPIFIENMYDDCLINCFYVKNNNGSNKFNVITITDNGIDFLNKHNVSYYYTKDF